MAEGSIYIPYNLYNYSKWEVTKYEKNLAIIDSSNFNP